MSDIRSALEEAFAEQDQTQDRDESGRFASKQENTQSEPTTQVEPVQNTAQVDQAIEQTQQEAPRRKAPSSWKKEAQEVYLKADRGEALTPEEVKLLTSEAERRESDFHRGLSEFQGHSQRARAYDQAIAPFQQHLQSLGVDAPTAISALMQADYKLRHSDPVSKAQYFHQLAREYGIDINQLSNMPAPDPQQQYLMEQMNNLRQQQMMWQNQVAQQEQERASAEITNFATADKQHFDAVRNDMADLLETGKAKDLQEAYDMAVWMRADIRQSLIEQQRQDAQRKAVGTVQAQRAKSASVSVKGSSPTGAGANAPSGSLRDIIAAQFDANF